MQIKIKTPAKINYTLEILNKRDDGYHEIQSIMQLINLYDYLTFDIEPSTKNIILLSGNSDKIPYDSKNIIYKAIKLFIEYANVKPHCYKVNIEKNIPTEAGLAGGSSNAVGTLLALNKYYNNVISNDELDNLCSKLGSDLNVILMGGCVLAKGRGENVTKLPFVEYPVSLIKPNIGISAKEGYTLYSQLKNKKNLDYTSKIIKLLSNKNDITNYLNNDLEKAVFDKYEDLQLIKSLNPKAIMSGSGSTYFILDNHISKIDNFWSKEDLKTISTGCEFI